MAVETIVSYAKSHSIPMCAVDAVGIYNEKKEKVSKKVERAYTDWTKHGRFEPSKVRQTPSGNQPTMFMLNLRKAGLFVIDVDVLGETTAKDIMTDAAWDYLYTVSEYVVQTGTGGAHFYFKVPTEDIEGMQWKNMTNVEAFQKWFKESSMGAVDVICDHIFCEGSYFVYDGKNYDYHSIKGSITDATYNEVIVNEIVEAQKRPQTVSAVEKTKIKKVSEKPCLITMDEVFEHLNNIGNKKQDWNGWWTMMQTVYNVFGDDGYALFVRWSEQHPSHNISELDKEWRRLKVRSDDKPKRTIRSILYLSEAANLETYKAILQKYGRGVRINDVLATQKFIELMGNHIVRDGKDVFVFDLTTGMWDSSEHAKKASIARFRDELVFFEKNDEGEVVKTHDYSGMESKIRTILSLLTSQIPDTRFIEKNMNSSKDKWLFSDGYYCRYTGFHEGFDPSIVFLKRINRPFPKVRDEKMIEYIDKILFRDPFKNPEMGMYMKRAYATGLAGEFERKKFYFALGKADCSKGVSTAALAHAFEGYVDTFSFNNLLYSRNSQDEAKKLAFLKDFKGVRLMIANEGRMDTTSQIDGNLLKSLASGGDTLKIRGNFEDQSSFINRATMVFLGNDVVPITPCDSGVLTRVRFMKYDYRFVSNPTKTYEKPAIENIKSIIQSTEFCDGLFWLMMDTLEGCTSAPIPEPDEVKMETAEWAVDDEKLIEQYLNECYEITKNEDDYVSSDELTKYFIDVKGMKISSTKLGRELNELIGSQSKMMRLDKKSIRVRTGIRRVSDM